MPRLDGLALVSTQDPALIRKAVLMVAREAGCRCQPDITLPPLPLRAGDLRDVEVFHDDWCPLLRRHG